MPGVMTARMPESMMASATASLCRYISHVVVMPLRSISSAPSSIPQ